MDGELSSLPNPPSNQGTTETASLLCPRCGTGMPPNAAFCPACGWSIKPIAAGDRALAALTYLPVIPAAMLLLLPAYRSHRFIRFHAWQSILIWGVFLVLTLAALFLSNVAAAMLFLGQSISGAVNNAANCISGPTKTGVGC